MNLQRIFSVMMLALLCTAVLVSAEDSSVDSSESAQDVAGIDSSEDDSVESTEDDSSADMTTAAANLNPAGDLVPAALVGNAVATLAPDFVNWIPNCILCSVVIEQGPAVIAGSGDNSVESGASSGDDSDESDASSGNGRFARSAVSSGDDSVGSGASSGEDSDESDASSGDDTSPTQTGIMAPLVAITQESSESTESSGDDSVESDASSGDDASVTEAADVVPNLPAAGPGALVGIAQDPVGIDGSGEDSVESASSSGDDSNESDASSGNDASVTQAANVAPAIPAVGPAKLVGIGQVPAGIDGSGDDSVESAASSGDDSDESDASSGDDASVTQAADVVPKLPAAGLGALVGIGQVTSSATTDVSVQEADESSISADDSAASDESDDASSASRRRRDVMQERDAVLRGLERLRSLLR